MRELVKYNKKRNFEETNEPIGKVKKTNKKLRFVVQHHLARKDHYDLRLEHNGVLLSWAVPKGPSYNPKDKRLAIKVEDHPLEYRNFEGTIPKGEYGGGIVMVWDKGYYEIKNKSLNVKNKTIKFTLYGSRLKGDWNLVLLENNNYLLIKEDDKYSNYKDISKYKTSIITNKTMEDINDTNVQNVKITSPDKIVYKNPNITKLDIIHYYEQVYEKMKYFLDKRLISTIRCPEGIYGECFFKKHLESSNKGLGMKKVSSKNNNKNDYYYIKNIEGLIYEVQMNGYEFHIWGSKVDNINKPDILVFDLDPSKNVGIQKIREGVKDLKSILDELNLKSYLKTSGGKGYHVVVPLNTKSWTETRKISKSIAELMESKWPDLYTSNIRKNRRNNKIFIDWVRNTKSSTSVAPYSLRAREGCPVSMPISWKDLDKYRPNEIKIKDALKLIKKCDPWKDFFE